MVTAHPEISWSVVLGASLTEAVPIVDVTQRIGAVFEARPELGPIPVAQSSNSTAEVAFDVAAAIADGLRRNAEILWVPPALRWVMVVLRHLPRPLFRKLKM